MVNVCERQSDTKNYFKKENCRVASFRVQQLNFKC